MLWLKLGWRNLWRNRRRTIIELSSIAGSVFFAMFMNNLATGSYNQMINSGVRMGSGHIGIYEKDYLELRRIDQTFEVEPLLDEIAAVPEVAAVYPRLHVPSLVQSSRENRPGGVIGIDFAREAGSNTLLNLEHFTAGGLPEAGDSLGAVMGYDLADDLELDNGNKFVVMAQDETGGVTSELFRIRGIFRTGANDIDAGTVIANRTYVANAIGRPGQVHEIAVMLHKNNQVKTALPKIRAIVDKYDNVRAYPWQEAMPDMVGAIEYDHTGLLIMVAFMYILVGIGTINTLLMSVLERTREFGVIRAIGLNSAGIRKMVFAEAFVLSVAGVLTGMLIAIGVGLYTSVKGIDYSSMLTDQSIAGTIMEPVIYSGWDWATMAWFGAAMIVLALVASLYPAHQILKRNPSDAMRAY